MSYSEKAVLGFGLIIAKLPVDLDDIGKEYVKRKLNEDWEPLPAHVGRLTGIQIEMIGNDLTGNGEYLLAAYKTVLRVAEGTIQIPPNHMFIESKFITDLRYFCRIMGIPWVEPAWHMATCYG